MRVQLLLPLIKGETNLVIHLKSFFIGLKKKTVTHHIKPIDNSFHSYHKSLTRREKDQ